MVMKASFEISFEVDGICPEVGDYTDKDLRSKASAEVLIKKEITEIYFSEDFSFSCHSKGGFSLLDIWRCIYEAFVKAFDGHWPDLVFLERISYNAVDNIVSIETGS